MFFRRRNIAAEKMKDTAQVGIVYASFIFGFFTLIFKILYFIFGTKRGFKWLLSTIAFGVLLLFGILAVMFSYIGYEDYVEDKKQQEQFINSGFYEKKDALVFKEEEEYFRLDRHTYGSDRISAAVYKNSNIGLTQEEQSVISNILDRGSIYIKIRNCHGTNDKSKVCRDALGAYKSFENIIKNNQNFIKGKNFLLAKSSKIEIYFDYGGFSVSADKPRY